MQWTSVLSLALFVQAQATVVRTAPENQGQVLKAQLLKDLQPQAQLLKDLHGKGPGLLPPRPPSDIDDTTDLTSLDTSTKIEDTATKLLAGNKDVDGSKAAEAYNAKENANYEEAVDDETAAAQEEAAETAAQVEAEMKEEAKPKKKEEAKEAAAETKQESKKAAAKTEKKDAKAAKKGEAKEEGAAKEGAKKEEPTLEVADAPAPAPAPAAAPAAAPETPKSTTTGPQTPAQRRMRTINHVKEAGEGYQPGSPLYEHQEKYYKTHEKSAAFQHMPLACLVVALTASLA